MTSDNSKYKRDGGRSVSKIDYGTMVYGKIPPQAKDLEQAILGAIMLEKDMMDRVGEYIKPETFYVEAHQHVFQAMMNLSKKGWPIDILTVCEELRAMEQLEMIGGDYYIAKLTNTVVSGANIVHHCRIVQDKFVKRELIRIGGELISGGYDDASDIKDLMDQHEKNFTELSMDGTGTYTTIDTAIVNSIQRIEKLRLNDSHMTGIPSGFIKIDQITHGWQDTDLIILAARPAVGKTAFALNLARNAVMNSIKPVPVALFSLEMSVGQLTNRILAAESEIWLDKISNGRMTIEDMKMLYKKAVQPLANARLYIDDTPALNLFELRARARRMKRKFDIGLIIIDYLQLMSGDSNDSKNREREIAQISRGLKALAKELQVPIIALSQLSRNIETRKGENKTPQLSDLRESGAIEQDADLVIFIDRPEYYDQISDAMGESTKGLTRISISKHRNGTLATGNEAIKLKALLHIQKFTDWDSMEDVKAVLGQGSWRPVENDNSKDLSFD